MRNALALGLLALSLVAAAACDGPLNSLPADPYGSYGPYGDGGDEASGDTPGDDASGAGPAQDAGSGGDGSVPAFPPISATPPARAPALCANGAAPAAYVMGSDGTLFSFQPRTLEMQALGVISCETQFAPGRFTVTPSGTAYVLYGDALYEVDLATLACRPTAYASQQLGFDGYAGIAVGTSRTADRLYFYEGPGFEGSNLPSIAHPVLGVSDLASFQLFDVGAQAPAPAEGTVDLKTDAFGRLFTLGLDGTLYEIDPSTSGVIGADPIGIDWGTALLTYDGEIYVFDGDLGGVTRYDLATKAIDPVGALNVRVNGASAVPCLSASEPGADGGPDGGEAPEGGAADGGAPSAAAPSAFAPGDVWIGTYACGQGVTNLAIVVETVDGDTLTARFDFGTGSASAQGSYELAGTFDPATGEATFTPGAWDSQPVGGVAPVGLDGHLDLSGTSYAGNVTSGACGAFSVTR